MTPFAEEKFNRINALKVKPVMDFLLNHLNPKATSNEALFTLKQAYARKTKSGNYNNRLSNDVIFLAFAYLPESACQELAKLILSSNTQAGNELVRAYCNTPYHLKIAPASVRPSLYRAMRSLHPSQKCLVLFGAEELNSLILIDKNLLRLLREGSEEEQIAIIQLLASIPLQEFISVISDFNIPTLLNALNSEQAALTFLQWLGQWKMQRNFLFGLSETKLIGTVFINLVNAIIKLQSEDVLQALAKLIGKTKTLKKGDLTRLFSHCTFHTIPDSESLKYCSVIEALLSLYPGSAAAFLRAFPYPEVLSLLTRTSRKQPDSFLHQAIQLNLRDFIQTYLSLDENHLNHINYKQQSALEYAKSLGRHEIVAFHDALMLQRRLQNSLSETDRDEMLKAIEDNPAVHSVSLANNNTLLHLALQKKEKRIVIALLQAGSNPHSPNASQLSPLDIAYGMPDYVLLFAQHAANLQLTYSNNAARSPLLLAVQQQHHKAVKRIIRYLRNHSDYDFEASFIQICPLFKEAALSQALTAFPSLLSPKPEQQSLSMLFEEACERNQHIKGTVLLESTTLPLSKLLQQAFMEHVEAELKLLVACSGETQKKAVQQTLLMFLFTLPFRSRIEVLSRIVLDRTTQKELDWFLSFALAQPLIISSISHEEIEGLLPFIRDKEAKVSLANVHFRRSKLKVLPDSLLQYFATLLTREQLLMHIENRLSAQLIVLTLEKLFTEESVDEGQVEILFSKLERELALYNQAHCSLSLEDLQQSFNLATQDRIKQRLHLYIHQQNKDSPLIQRLDTLFANYRKNQALTGKGFLREWFIQLANKPSYASSKQFKRALADLMKTMSLDEFKQVLASYELRLTQRPLALARAASSAIQEPAISPYLVNLESKLIRSELTSQLNLLDDLHARLSAFQQLLPAVNAACHSALNQLSEQLSSFTDELIRIHLQDRPFQATEELLRIQESLQEKGGLTVKSLQQLAAYLTPPLWAQAQELEIMLKDELCLYLQGKTTAYIKEIAAKEQQFEQQFIQLLKDEDLQDATALFFTQNNTMPGHHEALDTAWRRQQTITTEAQQLLLSALLTHPSYKALLPHWFKMHLKFAQEPETRTAFLKHLSAQRLILNEQQWADIDKPLDEQWALTQQTQWLLTQLMLLSLKPPVSLLDIAKLLEQQPTAILAAFAALGQQTQRYDLDQLIRAVMHCQRQQISVTLYLQQAAAIEAGKWLADNVNTLQQYNNYLLTLKTLKIGLYTPGADNISGLQQFRDLLTHAAGQLDSQTFGLWLKSYQAVFETERFSPEALEFTQLFSELFQKASYAQQSTIIQNLPDSYLAHLIEQALSGLTADNPQRLEACKTLLTSLTQLGTLKAPDKLELIKNQLSAQDLNLLGDEELIEMARSILSTKDSSLADLTCNGIWIQRLLISPHFVAAAPAGAIQQLLERYRLISMTLKQDEFDTINRWLQDKMAFSEHHQASMTRLHESMLAQPDRREHWLQKRERLLKFRADDAVRALLNRLEDECIGLMKTNHPIANKARDHLYTHYQQQLSGLRSDLLFNCANFIYNKTANNKGDLAQANSSLLQWMQHYLPHQNFEQSELARKQRVMLYNASGEQIGFINESNQAMTFEDDLPCSLLSRKGIHSGLELYDKNRQHLGILTATGEVKRENIFQKNTSALLLGKVDIEQLEKAGAAFELLLHDILTENALDTLYESEEVANNPEKRQWCEEQITARLIDWKRPVANETLQAALHYHSPQRCLQLLAETSHRENALALFNTLLLSEKRGRLWTEDGFAAFKPFVRRFGAVVLLADCLLHYRQQPWFEDMLELFGRFAKETGDKTLVNKSLLHLADLLEKGQLGNEDCQAVLQALIANNARCQIVLDDFFQLRGGAIESQRSAAVDGFTAFLTKSHLISLLQALNQTKNLTIKEAQYRLVLLAFSAHQKTILQQNELRYSNYSAWQAADLQCLTGWLTRHLATSETLDTEKRLGLKLLDELVFRSANFGQIQLFYHPNGQLNTAIAHSTLQRSRVETLIASFQLTKEMKQNIMRLFSNFKGWFDNKHNEQQALTDFLKKNHALLDWKQLVNESWATTDKEQLPLIIPFIMHYSGAATSLTRLIEDVIQHTPQQIPLLARLMVMFPQRDMSALIFKSLISACKAQPKLLDRKLFNDLARYHSLQHLKTQPQNPQAELALLKHLGQQKNYTLVHQGCSLLLQQQAKKPKGKAQKTLRQTLKAAKTEAWLENKLSAKMGGFFFRLSSSIRRWWNYSKKPSGIVKFCDDNSPYANPESPAPTLVKSTVLGGQSIAGQLSVYEKTNLAKPRLEAWIKKSAKVSVVEQSIFKQSVEASHFSTQPAITMVY